MRRRPDAARLEQFAYRAVGFGGVAERAQRLVIEVPAESPEQLDRIGEAVCRRIDELEREAELVGMRRSRQRNDDA